MKFFNILKEVVTTKAYAARTYAQDPLQSFRFMVSIGNASLGFKSVGGLSREVEVVEYLEGMYAHAHKLPGRETTSEVTFERGMYEDSSLEPYFKSVFNSNDSRFDVTINILDRGGKIRKTFRLGECWFSNYQVSDLAADSSDVIIETLTLQFEQFL